jgi:hypothetical protein
VVIIRLIQVFEEKACYFTFSLGSEISERKITGFLFKNLYQPDDDHQMAETCSNSLSSIA